MPLGEALIKRSWLCTCSPVQITLPYTVRIMRYRHSFKGISDLFHVSVPWSYARRQPQTIEMQVNLQNSFHMLHVYPEVPTVMSHSCRRVSYAFASIHPCPVCLFYNTALRAPDSTEHTVIVAILLGCILSHWPRFVVQMPRQYTSPPMSLLTNRFSPSNPIRRCSVTSAAEIASLSIVDISQYWDYLVGITVII